MKLIFNDDGFSFRLLCAIGRTPYGGADIGECLSTAYRIKMAILKAGIVNG